MNTKRKYSLEKAIADTRIIQGKLILDEDKAQAINELLIELKAYRKIVRKMHSLTTDLETAAKKSLDEKIMMENDFLNMNPNSPYVYGIPRQGFRMR